MYTQLHGHVAWLKVLRALSETDDSQAAAIMKDAEHHLSNLVELELQLYTAPDGANFRAAVHGVQAQVGAMVWVGMMTLPS